MMLGKKSGRANYGRIGMKYYDGTNYARTGEFSTNCIRVNDVRKNDAGAHMLGKKR